MAEDVSRLRSLFAAAVELPPELRAEMLARESAGNPQMLAELHALLEADARVKDATARPIVSGLSKRVAASAPRAAQVGPYELRQEIGRGGMSTVYLAERSVPGGTQRVALKCLHPLGAYADFVRRFHSEIAVLAQLSHPHIARFIDAGQESDGGCWIAMEFIEGVPLLQYCDALTLPGDARLALFDTLCDAVSAAHRSLIVHRDIKSSNVLVRDDGELFLIDFGIARALTADAEVTQPEQRFLSPANAAPEQILGAATTTSCDVYGLGALLYELLVGMAPIDPAGPSGEAVRNAVLHHVPQLASVRLRQIERSDRNRAQQIARDRSSADSARLARSLAGDLEQICAVALRKQPRERYASVEQLREDLSRATSGRPLLVRSNDRLYRSVRWLQRNAVVVAFAAATTVALVAGVTVLWQQARSLERERDHAREQTQLAQRQAQRAEFLSTFLLDAFEQADPSRTMGMTLTAKQILDAGVRRLQSGEDTDPELRASIAITLADVEYRLGLYADSERLVDFARARVAELQHPPGRLIARLRYVEGMCAGRNSKFADSQRDAESGLAALGDPDDAASESTWVMLKRLRADVAVAADDRARALALYRELVASIGSLHWIRRADAWDLRMRLAHQLDLDADTRPEARAILTAVLQEQSGAHADDSPVNARAKQYLASVELRSKNAHLARQYAQQALAAYERAYGDKHPIIARALTQLANTEKEDGDARVAIQHYDQADHILEGNGPTIVCGFPWCTILEFCTTTSMRFRI